MSVFEHLHRARIYNPSQHPYKHPLSDFLYSNPAVPGVSNLEAAMDYMFAVIYPKSKDAVATPADLPASGNTIGDFRVVTDDGDGKAAGYQWQQREGDVTASWYKIYDMDWGSNEVLSGFLEKTQDLYVYRYGYNDLDATGTALTGVNAGQHIYGGASANTHLTLHANSGDGVGSATGYVQIADNFRPTSDNAFDIGTTANRLKKLWAYATQAGTLLLSAGSITDSSGAVSFDNENLSTTGTLASGTHTIGGLVLASGSITDGSGAISFDNENVSTTGFFSGTTLKAGTLTVGAGSITDSSGAISFDNENLSTTGTLSSGNFTSTRTDTDNVRIDGNTVSILNSGGSLNLGANGAGVVNVTSAMTTIAQTVTGVLGVTGQITIDNLSLDGNTLSTTDTNGNLVLSPNGSGVVTVSSIFKPTADGTKDLGTTAARFQSIYFSGSLGDGTTAIAQSVLQSLRGINTAVSSGMTIFWTGSQWQPSLPDTEVDHGTLSGLGDDDHTQYLLLLGRSGGQAVIGGTASGNNLTLESTSNASKGKILTKDTFAANTDASFSSSWAGTDLGGSSNRFRHLYTAGECFGLRPENLSSDPSSSAQKIGRLWWNTTSNYLGADTGAAIVRLSMFKYQTDTSWDGSTLVKNVTVSGVDATQSIIQLKDNTNDYHNMDVDIRATSTTNVRITANVALPAGSYRLICIQ